MDVINVSNLSFSFGVRPIFEDVSFSISESDKCGLIGVNGSGKTTLFKLICGDYTADSGSIWVNRNCSMRYLKQSSEGDGGGGSDGGGGGEDGGDGGSNSNGGGSDGSGSGSSGSDGGSNSNGGEGVGGGSSENSGGSSENGGGSSENGGGSSENGGGGSDGGGRSSSGSDGGSNSSGGSRSSGIDGGSVVSIVGDGGSVVSIVGGGGSDGGNHGGVVGDGNNGDNGGASSGDSCSSSGDGGATIGDAVRNVFKPLIDMEARMRRMEDEISLTEDSVRQLELIRKCDLLRVSYEMAGGYEYQSRIRGIMKGLDIGKDIYDETLISTLSEGQKTRLSLALILANPPDILLLDEPTNHLDVRSLEWLEEFLHNHNKCFIIISHDRYFLDKITTKIIELEHRTITTYCGNYSFSQKKKSEDRLIKQRHYLNQQKEIARLEAYIEQQRRWNRERNIVAAESRQKAIDRIERIDKPENLPSKISMKFRKTSEGGNDAMFINNISKSYGDHLIFKNFTAIVKKKERVFVIGPNGCGKSTLMRVLAGRLSPDKGNAEVGNKTKVGYYDQRLSDLDGDKTVLEEILYKNNNITLTDARNLLGSFLFSGDDAKKKISTLSGGEKSRIALAKLILSDANLLLLDEPTNHLDINSREAFENALQSYDGTIISVSHDRYFIKNFATRIISFNGCEIRDFQGDYEDFLIWKDRSESGIYNANNDNIKDAPGAFDIANEKGQTSANARASSSGGANTPASSNGGANNPASSSGGASNPASSSGGANTPASSSGNANTPASSSGGANTPANSSGDAKNEYLKLKEIRSAHKKLLSRIKRTEDHIGEIETRLAEIEAEMASDEVISDHVALSFLSSEQANLNSELDEHLNLWEELSNLIDNYNPLLNP